MAQATPRRSARERLLDAAYRLFAAQGIERVGVDAIVARSGCAKATLYNNFSSKEQLALAFLERREHLWTRGWLEADIRRHADDPQAQLLAIFDLFDGWFRRPDFEGCSFINVMLESNTGSAVHGAAAGHLEKIRSLVRECAAAAGLDDVDSFAHCWHMLMKGSIVAAGEGHRDAARDAQRAARLVLQGWPRRG